MKNIRAFVSENFQFLEVKFSVYLNRRVFVIGSMRGNHSMNMSSLACKGMARKASEVRKKQWSNFRTKNYGSI